MSFNVESSTSKAETEGVWVDFMASEFLVASSNSVSFQRMFAALQRPYMRQIQKGTLDPSIQLEIMCKTLAKTALLGWRNVVDNSGAEVPYSAEVAYTALKNNTEFRTFIIETASDIATFKVEEVNDMVK